MGADSAREWFAHCGIRYCYSKIIPPFGEHRRSKAEWLWHLSFQQQRPEGWAMQTRSPGRCSECWRGGLVIGYTIDGRFGGLLLSPTWTCTSASWAEARKPLVCSVDVWLGSGKLLK